MPHISTTSRDRHDINLRLEQLALSALFSAEQLQEVCLVARERDVSPADVIRNAVLDNLVR